MAMSDLGPVRKPDSTTSAGIFGSEADKPTKVAVSARIGAPAKPVPRKKAVPIKITLSNQKAAIKQPVKQSKSC